MPVRSFWKDRLSDIDSAEHRWRRRRVYQSAARRACLGTDLLWVNKNGERFITEDDAGPFNGGNAVGMLVLLTIRHSSANRPARRAPRYSSTEFPLALQLGPLPNLHEELICQAEQGG